MLPERKCEDYNCSAITGIANVAGDYRGPTREHHPNPRGWWWGMVLRKNVGWRHVQALSREAVEKKMLALGADVSVEPIPAP
jgi:hypothetical protein